VIEQPNKQNSEILSFSSDGVTELPEKKISNSFLSSCGVTELPEKEIRS